MYKILLIIEVIIGLILAIIGIWMWEPIIIKIIATDLIAIIFTLFANLVFSKSESF